MSDGRGGPHRERTGRAARPDTVHRVMSSIAEEFAARGFRADFRRYQRLALEHGRVAGDATCYVVMPPGAGKTVVGLELARRIGRRTLVLVPNTAVLGQWASTWDERFPAGDAREVAPCATDRSLDAPLTVLTYQSLAVIDDGHAAAERRCAVRGRDHEALLAMLHPNGRELVARAAATGPWTLVLDECHHLLDTWGALVGALVDELGAGTTVIGLTATPPRLLTGWQRELHDDLFGTADVEVPAPALVRDGDLRRTRSSSISPRRRPRRTAGWSPRPRASPTCRSSWSIAGWARCRC